MLTKSCPAETFCPTFTFTLVTYPIIRVLRFALFSDSILPLAVIYALFEFSVFPATFTGIAGKSAKFSFLSLPQEVNNRIDNVIVIIIFFISFIYFNYLLGIQIE